MAAPFFVNIHISPGVGFSQVFTMANADRTALDLTGASFTAKIAKHSRAQNVLAEGDTQYKNMNFTAEVDNAASGTYKISLTPEQTTLLIEGKYVYNVTMTNINGETFNVLEGLAFVDNAFASLE